jgi:hypothetical protein
MITTRLVNAFLTPVTLILSGMVLYRAVLALDTAIKTNNNKSEAIILAGIGLLFSIFAILSLAIYSISIFTNLGWGHILSGWRSLTMHVIIQWISILWLRLYSVEI